MRHAWHARSGIRYGPTWLLICRDLTMTQTTENSAGVSRQTCHIRLVSAASGFCFHTNNHFRLALAATGGFFSSPLSFPAGLGGLRLFFCFYQKGISGWSWRSPAPLFVSKLSSPVGLGSLRRFCVIKMVISGWSRQLPAL